MPFRVLSINGGGMRGIYAAAYLEALESTFIKRTGRDSLDIGKGFDLIAGTSTGAIIGCGLAKGVSPIEMVNFYKNNGAQIFPLKLPDVSSKKIIRGLKDVYHQVKTRPESLRCGEAALEKALTEAFGEMTFKQVWDDRKIALAITAVKMSNYKPRVFKTPHNVETNHCDDNLTLVKACLASSAAPIYRSLAAIDHETDGSYEVYADGGLWANNPIIVALTESLRILNDLGRNDV